MEEKNLFNKYNKGKHWENHPTLYAEKFVEFLKNNNFIGKVIDIGCGDGRDVQVFSKAGFETFGIDCSKKEIDLAKKKFPKLKFEVQNVENMSFEDNSVDAYFMINVIHYVKKEEAIQEILRTLKPKGFFFIHFNIEIRDQSGKIDYEHPKKAILELISEFEIVYQNIFERVDQKPIKHQHKIIEFVLQKK